MRFSIGEVVLLPIPFTDLTSRKVRPAVVVGHSTREGDLFVVPISSQAQNIDFSLTNWRGAAAPALLQRVEEREISFVQLIALGRWLDTDPKVPERFWFKRFEGFIVCGEGELIKTVLTGVRRRMEKKWVRQARRGGRGGRGIGGIA